jgi:hypothetical protein
MHFASALPSSWMTAVPAVDIGHGLVVPARFVFQIRPTVSGSSS